MPELIRSAHKSSWHVWPLLAGTVAFGVAAEWAANLLVDSYKLSQMASLSLYMAVLGAVVLVSGYFLNAHLPDDIRPADESLVLRYRRSGFRHVALVICIVMFYPAGYTLSHQVLHASETESFLLGNLPCVALGALLHRAWPISAGSPAETVRAELLLVDRTRRAQSFSFAAFACVSLFVIVMMMPDFFRALHGEKAHLGIFSAFAVTALASIFMLSSPWNWFVARSATRIMEDETLARFRLLAYRNGFFVLAFGLVAIGDLVRDPPRLALVMVPIVFNLAMFTAFATLFVLEVRAGTLKSEDPLESPPKGGALT
jgi:hypothetical protein